MTADNAQIVDGCRRGDRKAQRALYDMTAPMALGVCMRYAASRAEAEDLMQDGYVRVFENIGRLKEPKALQGWVRQVMTSVCINTVRRRVRFVSLDKEPVEAVDTPMDVFADEEVVHALQRLAPQKRTVFNMVAVEEMGYDEVAAKLKCSESNVRALFSRAKKELTDILIG